MKTKIALKALSALSQASRLAVFRLLVRNAPTGLSAGEIAEWAGVLPATLSFHLKGLTAAGLIQPRQEGRFVIYSANLATMTGLVGYLTENCCGGKPCAAVAEPSATKRAA